MKPQFPKETIDGSFNRQNSIFRNEISPGKPFSPEPDRYHLYLSYACPWAHRTLIVLQLKGLGSCISHSFVDPIRDERGWRFDQKNTKYNDPINQFSFLSEVYKKTDPDYSIRVTVPVLWDKQDSVIVNNESSDIIVYLNNEFNEYAKIDIDLYPDVLKADIDKLNDYIYHTINNGVYKCGFATSQIVYEREVESLFKALDTVDQLLKNNPYLIGESITLADIRLFTTLIRFDAVYYGHFKTNKKHIYEFENLWQLVKTLYAMPEIGPTVKFDEIKSHYYVTHETINPTGVVPVGPNIQEKLTVRRKNENLKYL
tara:strand:+ start:84 stop:1025 length:942 start_codon:yes stop_codon:yes gene_type:complete